jgi:hypothetical protein
MIYILKPRAQNLLVRNNAQPLLMKSPHNKRFSHMLHEYNDIYSVRYYTRFNLSAVLSWNVLPVDTGVLLYYSKDQIKNNEVS